MAGGCGGPGGTYTAGTSRALFTGASIHTGADSAEKMFLPVPAYTTSSLSASLSKCKEGSMPAFVSFSASGPAAVGVRNAATWRGAVRAGVELPQHVPDSSQAPM